MPLFIIPAYASCQTVHECTYINVPNIMKNELFLPDDPIMIEPGNDGMVIIAGTMEDKLRNATVTLTVTLPDNSKKELTILGTADGFFHTAIIIHGDRHSEGKYSVSAKYEYIRHKEVLASGSSSGSFTVELDGEKPDHTIIITTDEKGNCGNSCYDKSNIVIPPRGTIQWINDSNIPHNIRSSAVFDGNDVRLVEEGDKIFRSGLLKPNHSKIMEYDGPTFSIFACIFHPWMEGTITITETTTQSEISITQIETEEEKPARLSFRGGTQWHNGGDMMRIDILYENSDSTSVNVSIIDSKSNSVFQKSFPRNVDSHARIMTQPSWEPGSYILQATISDSDVSFLYNLEITQHDIKCSNWNGLGNDCFAGVIEGVTNNHSIKFPDRTITLAVSKLNQGEDAENTLRDMCRPGSIAIVDIDDTLTGDTKDVGAVYCNGMTRPVNLILLEEGLADRDEVECLTTEFEWGRCHDPEEILESVGDTTIENVVDAIIPDELMPPISESDDCMIAFAVRGTELAHPVQLLREYRSIINHGMTADIIHNVHAVYYSISPYMVEIMKNNDYSRTIFLGMIYAPLQMAGALLG